MKINLDNQFMNQNPMELRKVTPIAQAGGGFGGTVAYRFGKFLGTLKHKLCYTCTREILNILLQRGQKEESK